MYKNRGRTACEMAGFEVIRFGGVMGVRIGLEWVAACPGGAENLYRND